MLNEAMLRNMGPAEVARELLDHADPAVRLLAGAIEGEEWVPESEVACHHSCDGADADDFEELEDRVDTLEREADDDEALIKELAEALRAHEPDHPALERAK